MRKNHAKKCIFIILNVCISIQLGCSDPMQDRLPNTFEEFLVSSRHHAIADSDRMAIARFYDRHKTFSDVKGAAQNPTVASALAEQRQYEQINLTAIPDGEGISPDTGQFTSHYGVALHSSPYDIYEPVTGVSGILDLLNEFNEILLSQEVRVYEPESEFRLKEIWIPMNSAQRRELALLDRSKLGVCFRPGLKIKQKSGSIKTIDFPLCYKQSVHWKLSVDERLRLQFKQ